MSKRQSTRFQDWSHEPQDREVLAEGETRRTENPERNPDEHGHVILDQGGKAIQCKKAVFPSGGAGTTGHPGNRQTQAPSHQAEKTSLKWITCLNAKRKTQNTFRRNRRLSSGRGKEVLKVNTKSKIHKTKHRSAEFHQNQRLLLSERLCHKREKTKESLEENTCQTQCQQRATPSRIYKEVSERNGHPKTPPKPLQLENE